MKITESKLRNIIREELSKLNEAQFEAHLTDPVYVELLDALENEFGREAIGYGPKRDHNADIWFRKLGERYWTVKVSNADLAQRVQKISDRVGARLDLL